MKGKVTAVLNEEWIRGMARESTLGYYQVGMEEMGATPGLYDNSQGSRLLAEARAGVLRTRAYRARYESEVSPECTLCGMGRETVHSAEEYLRRLGLGEGQEKPDRRLIQATKM